MNGITQANRLEQLVQEKSDVPIYELALPLVMVHKSMIKTLEKNDVIILGLDILECILLKKNQVYSNLMLKNKNNSMIFELNTMIKETNMSSYSKKYETLKVSFGTIDYESIKIGNTIDLAVLNFENVDLVLNHEIIATASLVNVNDEIAVEINKVIKNEYKR